MSIISIYKKNIVTTAAVLMAFAVAGAALVGLTFSQTIDDIKYNEKMTLLRKLNTIIPTESYDNDMLSDAISISPDSLLGTQEETLAYRARKNNLGKERSNVAVVLSSVAPNGYNGPIELLVGIYADGRLAGVRVVKHRETPGLGDVISIGHSNWILGFNDKSLGNPDEKGWKVKRDGGVFDQFTGATITPRAVVKAIHDALLYFEKNRAKLFEIKDKKDKKDKNAKEKAKKGEQP